jgi:flavin-dependent thymidylate synthase
MKVTLLDYTGAGCHIDYAIDLLIFTKGTRLQMSPAARDEIRNWPYDKKIDEIKYMANTIPSSWEFVDYTFMIEGVTRAFTHQLVRTRTASFAQQTMRVLNVGDGPGWDYLTGPTIEHEPIVGAEDPTLKAVYDNCMENISKTYNHLIVAGAAIEDARGVLPTNILTNIVMKCNMRTFVEMVHKRSSPRTQGEYRNVLDAMKTAALGAHPWLTHFVERTFDKAASDLDKEISEIDDTAKRTRMIKLVDQLRAKQ